MKQREIVLVVAGSMNEFVDIGRTIHPEALMNLGMSRILTPNIEYRYMRTPDHMLGYHARTEFWGSYRQRRELIEFKRIATERDIRWRLRYEGK